MRRTDHGNTLRDWNETGGRQRPRHPVQLHDGYVAGAGVILAGWYTEPTKIEELLALGDLSQLAEELDSCIAYHRDRHEPMRPAWRFASVDEYQRLAEGQMGADYLYVYDDGKWLVYGLYNVPEWVHVEVKKDAEML